MNLSFKGYNKDKDIRYALSENEVLIEVRDKQNRVHRLCKTLLKEIDMTLSNVELLVDFICIKLKKLESGIPWNSLGYDVPSFTMPMKS